MTWEYIGASIRELLVVGLIAVGVHAAVEHITGVHMLDRAVTDFRFHPVPQWTWPTWTIIGLIIAVIALEIVYRTALSAEKRRNL